MKTKIKKAISRPTIIRRLKKALDREWSLAVRRRDGNKCVVCSRTDGLSAHHWITRKARSLGTRWLIDNGATLCYSDHICQIHRYGEKEFMDRFFGIMAVKIPIERQEEIKRLSHMAVELDINNLAEILHDLKGRD